MARKKGKKGTMGSSGSSSVSSTVSNVSNTGQSSRVKKTTGATGSVTNTIDAITVQGTVGMPGRETSATITLPGGWQTNPSQQDMPIHSTNHGPTMVNDALDNAETHLTNARARVETAIANVPAEHQARVRANVDAAFARGSEAISNTRKRYPR